MRLLYLPSLKFIVMMFQTSALRTSVRQTTEGAHNYVSTHTAPTIARASSATGSNTQISYWLAQVYFL